MTTPVRRCPQCGEEFLTHIVNCSDCGAVLEDALEGEDARRLPERPGPSSAPSYVGLLSGLTPETVAEAAHHLDVAGIPCAVESDSRRGLRIGVAKERVRDAMAILGREGVVPAPPESAEGAVAVEGGPCPACGERVLPGTVECPECGLALSGVAPECVHCGAELNPVFDACPECAREQA